MEINKHEGDIDRIDMVQLLHSYGINLRHCGLVAQFAAGKKKKKTTTK